MRRISWWWWAVAAVAVALYVLAGIRYGAHVNGDLMYNIGAIAACAAALAFIGVYTVLGLRGGAKWWRSDLGSLLVVAVAATLPTSGVITYAVFFHDGLVNTLPLAWTLIGGTYLSALMILGLTGVVLRINRDNGNGR